MPALPPARALLSRIRQLFDRRRDADLDDEIALHLEMEIEYNVSRGMAAADARRAAIAAFGGVHRFREEARDARGVEAVDSLIRDGRLALRRLGRARLYTAGVILTLAIGFGAATGLGSLVYSVLLRPLPYPDADRLVRISIATPGLGITTTEQSRGTFTYFRDHARSFSMMGAYLENEGVIITDGDEPERVTGAIVTPNLFEMVGVRAAAGRLLTEADDNDAMTNVMLGFDLWQRRYGGDPAIVGGFIELQRMKRRVVGVLPRGLDFPSADAAIYYPTQITARAAGLTNRNLTVVGKLRTGISVDQARAELEHLVPGLTEQYPALTKAALEQSRLRPVVEGLRDAIVGSIRGELTLLAIIVAVVLIIAISNVTTLGLLRAQGLRAEVDIARALGATARRIAQRFLVEGFVLVAASVLFATPVAMACVVAASRFDGGRLPRIRGVRFGIAEELSLMCVASLVAIGLGLVSALRAGAWHTHGSLRADARRTPARAWRRVQQSLVVVQIAMALSLLVAAGLMGRSLMRLGRVDPGVAVGGGATFATTIPRVAYPHYSETAEFHTRAVRALAQIPGVTGAAAATDFPLEPQLLSVHPGITPADDPSSRGASVDANMVTPNFFSVMGMAFRAGHGFTLDDIVNPSTPPVVLGSSLARTLFGTTNPIGRELRLSMARAYPLYRVVGVVGDVYADRIASGPLLSIYFPLATNLPGAVADSGMPLVPAGVHYVVRSELPLATLTPEMRTTLASIDPRVPMWGVRTLESLGRDATARVRFMMFMLALAAGATLILGAIGLYSVIAFAVTGRSREFAVRLAIGSTPGGVMGLVFREGFILAAGGMAAGVLLSIASGRLIQGLLFQVSAADALTYGATLSVVALAVALATWIPARRAARSDPSTALRTA